MEGRSLLREGVISGQQTAMSSMEENGSHHIENKSLQSICARIIAEEAKSFKNWAQLASQAQYFQTEACRPIMISIIHQAHSFYPMLRERQTHESLKEEYSWIDWDRIQQQYHQDQLEKSRFLQMKGNVLNRSSVEYDLLATTFPIEVLRTGVAWPPSVNPAKREQYLSDADFLAIFALTKDEFNRLPRFKRDNLKKDHKLF